MNDEPAMYFSTLSEKQDYKDAMVNAGAIPAALDFKWFGVHVDRNRAVGDISFAGHPVVIEVKTKENLVEAMLPPANKKAAEAGMKAGKGEGSQAQDQIWNMWILKQAGAVQKVAVIIRNSSEPLDPHVSKASWLTARRMLYKRAEVYGYSVWTAEDPADVAEIAKTILRTVTDPSVVEMPEPYIPRELLDQPPVIIQIAATVHGFAAKRSKMLAKDYTPAGFWAEAKGDVHDKKAEQTFTDKFRDTYGIKEKLLHECWVTANTRWIVPEITPGVFVLKDEAKLVKQQQERIET